MTWKEIDELEIGAKVMHKHLGECTVKDVMQGLGVVIIPTTKEGKALLLAASGCDYPTLEDDIRLLKKK